MPKIPTFVAGKQQTGRLKVPPLPQSTIGGPFAALTELSKEFVALEAQTIAIDNAVKLPVAKANATELLDENESFLMDQADPDVIMSETQTAIKDAGELGGLNLSPSGRREFDAWMQGQAADRIKQARYTGAKRRIDGVRANTEKTLNMLEQQAIRAETQGDMAEIRMQALTLLEKTGKAFSDVEKVAKTISFNRNVDVGRVQLQILADPDVALDLLDNQTYPSLTVEDEQRARLEIKKVHQDRQRAVAKGVAGSGRPIDNIMLANNGAFNLLPESEQAQIINSARTAQESVDNKARAYRNAQRRVRVGQIAIDIASDEPWTRNNEAVMASLKEVEATAPQVGSIRSMLESGAITDQDVLTQYRDQIIVEGASFNIDKVLGSGGLSREDKGKLVAYHTEIVRGPERQSAAWQQGVELINNYINGLGGPGTRAGRALRQATERESMLLRNLLPQYYERTRGYPVRPGTENIDPLQLAEDMIQAVDFQKMNKPSAEYMRISAVFGVKDAESLAAKVKDGTMSSLQYELLYPIMKQEEHRRAFQEKIDARDQAERKKRLDASDKSEPGISNLWNLWGLFGSQKTEEDHLYEELNKAIQRK